MNVTKNKMPTTELEAFINGIDRDIADLKEERTNIENDIAKAAAIRANLAARLNEARKAGRDRG